MARALLLALACAAAASAARYGDYSGVKMPAYGGGASDYDVPRDPAAGMPSDDYRGHSPDAPASLDYKYEEEPRMKTEKPSKDSEEPEVWRKPGRKQRGLMRPHDSVSAEVGSKYERDEEDVPKFRSSHRFPKHRSRLKNDVPTRDEEAPPRRPIKYSRDRKDDVSDLDRKDYFHVDKDDKEDFPEDKSKEFDDDVKFVNEATTVRRVIRRKPRDRHMKRPSGEAAYDTDLSLERHLKDEGEAEGPRRPRPGGLRPRERFRPVMDDDEEDPKLQSMTKFKSKAYDDYDDYYDMKRVNNIKNKLPLLLRRTSEEPPTPSSFLEMLRSNRRMFPPGCTPVQDEPAGRDRNRPRFTDRSTTMAAPTTTTTATTTTTPTTTTTTTTTTVKKTTTTVRTTLKATTVNAAALSLAEKSRLSIMKKDQRKEGQHVEGPSKKPPVLLQVTRLLPTVVMVEPPSSLAPHMRAHELSEDSPERIQKVKKLMRHKLVSDAKNIRELTENWDDMVCDYVDVSLIDSSRAPPLARLPLAPLPLAAVLPLLLRVFNLCLIL